MVEKSKAKKSSTNIVELEGYLKENNLSKGVSSSGKDYISGSLVIAISEEEEFRIRFMAMKIGATGEVNKIYSTLEALLPDHTTSIATLLNSQEGATFTEVKRASTRVWARGQFDSFDKKDVKNQIHSAITLRGLSAGIKDERSKTDFAPKAKFDIEAYIDAIKPEKTKEGEETGRIVISTYIPDFYSDVAFPAEFICESQSAVSSINAYHKGDTGRFVGFLRNAKKEHIIKGETIEFMDGTQEDKSRVTYSFANERIIEKMTYPYMEDNSKYISNAEIKTLLSNRASKLEELSVSPDKSVYENKEAVKTSSYKGFEI